MTALPHPVLPAGSLPAPDHGPHYRSARTLWLALELVEPEPAPAILESLAWWAESLTSTVVLRPGEGLLLEVQGSLRFFSGLGSIRQRVLDELERRGYAGRLATAPTARAASWLVRCSAIDVTAEDSLAGAVGRLPLTATGWPESVRCKLGQMGLKSIGDCLRLPRAGFARRIGRQWLDELDCALGKRPDPVNPCRAPGHLSRTVEFALETSDRAVFAEALDGMTKSLEQELRQRQAQVAAVTLTFRHLRRDATQTRMRFVDPVHARDRLLQPLLARIERIGLAEPVIELSLVTSVLLPLRAGLPELLPAGPDDPPRETGSGSAAAGLVECLRGRFGDGHVYGIRAIAEHRPERAWSRRGDHPAAGTVPEAGQAAHGRPLWLLPEPRSSTQGLYAPGSDAGPERIESGWWDGQDVRRDYHVVIGPAGEKLWMYRDCGSDRWYLHGIFG